jgi:signal transduction histidine kinase
MADFVIVVAALVAVGAGLLVGIRIGRELTRRKTAEADARKVAERASRLKDEFLATVSHELRTPLNAIVGWVHVLKTGSLNHAESQRALDAIDRNARAQTRLVADLLDEAVLSQGLVTLAVHPCDLEILVRNAVASLGAAARARGQRIEMNFESPGLIVDADETRVGQVVWQLVANAVKFTPIGGSIHIETACSADEVSVRVVDSGEGIEPDFLPFVFEPFRQGETGAKREGVGLGLSLVRHIVELHGGTVSAASRGKGRGATFTFSLPMPAADRAVSSRSG